MSTTADMPGENGVENEDLLRRSVARLREKTMGLGIEPYFKPVEIISVKPGEIQYRFTITNVHLNTNSYVHGGVLAVLTDAMTFVAANSIFEGGIKGVSLEMNLKYLHGMKKDDKILVKAEAVKSGKKFVVCAADFSNADGKLMARGSQTIYRIGPDKFRRSDESQPNPISLSKL